MFFANAGYFIIKNPQFGWSEIRNPIINKNANNSKTVQDREKVTIDHADVKDLVSSFHIRSQRPVLTSVDHVETIPENGQPVVVVSAAQQVDEKPSD